MTMAKISAPESTRSKVNPLKTLPFDAPQNYNDETSPTHERRLRKVDMKNNLVTMADNLAGTPMFHRNYRWQGADQVFPNKIDAMMRFVEKCFPYAKGGMLLVDEPKTAADYRRASIKHRILREKGFRHVVIVESNALIRILREDPKSDAKETNLPELYEQLGELPQ